MNFKKTKYYGIRVLENLLVSLPFVLVLIYNSSFDVSKITLFSAVLLAFYINPKSGNRVLPSPYRKRLFEFTQGFRKTFLVYILVAVLLAFSIVSKNFNLGGFALLVLFLFIGSFYQYPEPEYYVWSYAQSTKDFLGNKIKTALIYSLATAVPFALTLLAFFPTNYLPVLVILFIGLLYVILMILAKYSSYPEQIQLPQGIMIAMGVVLPPFMLFVFWYLYRQSIKKLNRLLP